MALAIGIGIYFQLPIEPDITVSLVIAVPVTVSLAILAFKCDSDRLRVIAILLSFMLLGGMVAQVRTYTVSAPVLSAKAEGWNRVIGRIVEIEHFDDSDRFTLDQLEIKKLSDEETPARIRIRVRSRFEAKIGDFIQSDVILRPPPVPSVPGVYNFARRAWFEEIGAVGFALGTPTIFERGDAPSTVVLTIGRMRDEIGRRLVAAFEDPDAAAVATALAIGDKSRIQDDVRDKLRAAGLAHLLAISGLHMALVVVILFSGSRAALAAVEGVALRYPIKKWAAVFAILGAFGYLLLAGATIPTQRAFLMALVAMTAVIIDRSPISLRLVAFAAMVVLIVTPEALLGPSFQLSFAAVTALISAYETPTLKKFQKTMQGGVIRRLLGYFILLSLTTLIASFATAPLVWYHFGQVAPYGLLGNLLAIPLMAFVIMPLLIIAVAGAMVLPLSALSILVWPLEKGLQLLLGVANWVSGLDGASIQLAPLHSWSILLVVGGGLWLCIWSGRSRLVGMPVMAAGFAVSFLFPMPDILVAGNGQLIAYRSGTNTVYLSTTGRERYAADLWLSQFGVDEAYSFPRHGHPDEASSMIRCDPLGCIIDIGGKGLVGIARDELALIDDCARNTIVVATEFNVPASRCKGASIIVDRKALQRFGGHSIYLNGRYPWSPPLEPVTVLQENGQRPWTGLPG